MKRMVAVLGLVAVWGAIALQLALFANSSSAVGASARASTSRVATAAPPRPQSRRSTATDKRAATVALVGDVHAEPPIADVLERGENPLAGMAPVLRRADIALANVETAVGVEGTPAEKQFIFQADPALWKALRRSGVDVVTLANNHALDYGAEALAETIAGARAAGLRVIGAGRDAREAYRPVVVGRRGKRVAFVGLTRVLPTLVWAAGAERPGLASAYDEPAALAAVRSAARRAERVVVAVHWGQELRACPDPVQRALAARLRDAGADVVAGHHPHVLQGIDRREGGLVAYSLGNFVFYARDEQTRATGVLTVRLGRRAVLSHRFEPARIDDEGRPQRVRGAARAQSLYRLGGIEPERKCG